MRGSVTPGNRFATRAIPAGEFVRQYGQPIGTSRGIAEGDAVTHANMSNDVPVVRDLDPELATPPPDYVPEADRRDVPRLPARGRPRRHAQLRPRSCRPACARATRRRRLRRSPSSPCSRASASRTSTASSRFRTTRAAAAQDGSTIEVMLRTLGNYADHPNVGGVVFIGLGCEKTNLTVMERFLAEHGHRLRKPTVRIGIQEAGGTEAAVKRGVEAVTAMLPVVNQAARIRRVDRRAHARREVRRLGRVFGALRQPEPRPRGRPPDRAGGTVLITEVPEFCGAEHILAKRAKDAETGRRSTRWWTGTRATPSKFGAVLNENPSPGNVAGGLLNITIKSLGAIAKAGHDARRGRDRIRRAAGRRRPVADAGAGLRPGVDAGPRRRRGTGGGLHDRARDDDRQRHRAGRSSSRRTRRCSSGCRAISTCRRAASSTAPRRSRRSGARVLDHVIDGRERRRAGARRAPQAPRVPGLGRAVGVALTLLVAVYGRWALVVRVPRLRPSDAAPRRPRPQDRRPETRDRRQRPTTYDRRPIFRLAVSFNARRRALRRRPDGDPRRARAPSRGRRRASCASTAVGLCGTDFHIFEGHGNYNTDRARPAHPARRAAADPRPRGRRHGRGRRAATCATCAPGDRVVIDQGRNCAGLRRAACEYCATGYSHQCEHYRRARHHRTARRAGGLPRRARRSTPCRAARDVCRTPRRRSPSRWRASSTRWMPRCRAQPAVHARRAAAARRVQTVLVTGAGPAGLLFVQYLRRWSGYEGRSSSASRTPASATLAEQFGAEAIDPAAVQHRRGGAGRSPEAGVPNGSSKRPGRRRCSSICRGAHAQAGDGRALRPRPYRRGHQRAQQSFNTASPASSHPTGASGAFDPDGRPVVYREALGLLESGRIAVAPFITHRYCTRSTRCPAPSAASIASPATSKASCELQPADGSRFVEHLRDMLHAQRLHVTRSAVHAARRPVIQRAAFVSMCLSRRGPCVRLRRIGARPRSRFRLPSFPRARPTSSGGRFTPARSRPSASSRHRASTSRIIWKGPLREDDREQQIQVVEGFLSQGVSGIVLAPLDARALVRPVEEAKAAGIPVGGLRLGTRVEEDGQLRRDRQRQGRAPRGGAPRRASSAARDAC